MDYTAVIVEELSFLQQQERQARQATTRDRILYLRLLKSDQCKSQRSAGEAIGLGERQSQRLWQVYRQQGYAAIAKSGYKPNFGKLDCWQISQLQHYLRQDQVSRCPALFSPGVWIALQHFGAVQVFSRSAGKTQNWQAR